jgi:hypothetical protein
MSYRIRNKLVALHSCSTRLGLFHLPSLVIPSEVGFLARLWLLVLSLGNFIPAKKGRNRLWPERQTESFTPSQGHAIKHHLIHPITKAYEEDWLNSEITEPERLLPLLKQYPEGVEEYDNAQ